MTSAHPTGLRALLAEPMAEQGAYAYAHHVAEHYLGTKIAPLIIWAYADREGVFYGQLSLPGDPTGDAIILRVEAAEPGAERLEANVACTDDADCRDAFAHVEDSCNLLAVLDGGTGPNDDVICYTHDI